MSEDGQSPVTIPEGITPAAPEVNTGQTNAAPAVSPGQTMTQPSPEPGQAQAAPQTEEPTFFDPSTVAEELKPAYKQMQAAFTRKMQGLSTEKQKIEAYNNFMADPIGQMQQLAGQYGYSLTRAQAAQAVAEQQQGQSQQWEPQSWDEVMRVAEDRVMQKLQPFIGKIQQQSAQTIERQLSEIDPQWRIYEDQMRNEIQQHPTLVNDVAKLYRLSVPEEVLTSRAVQAALAKFQSKAEQVKVGSATRTSRTEPATPDITKMKDTDAFQAAVEIAKKSLGGG